LADQPLLAIAGKIDAVLHRLMSLQDEVTPVKETLALIEWKIDDSQSRGGELELRFEGVENRMVGVEAAVFGLDERLSRIEKRLEDLASGQGLERAGSPTARVENRT
jgi:predicted  nucleic acid-binding Zn-ribbon protein